MVQTSAPKSALEVRIWTKDYAMDGLGAPCVGFLEKIGTGGPVRALRANFAAKVWATLLTFGQRLAPPTIAGWPPKSPAPRKCGGKLARTLSGEGLPRLLVFWLFATASGGESSSRPKPAMASFQRPADGGHVESPRARSTRTHIGGFKKPPTMPTASTNFMGFHSEEISGASCSTFSPIESVDHYGARAQVSLARGSPASGYIGEAPIPLKWLRHSVRWATMVEIGRATMAALTRMQFRNQLTRRLGLRGAPKCEACDGPKVAAEAKGGSRRGGFAFSCVGLAPTQMFGGQNVSLGPGS